MNINIGFKVLQEGTGCVFQGKDVQRLNLTNQRMKDYKEDEKIYL